MKYLRNFNTQDEYKEQFLDYDTTRLETRVNLVKGEVNYYNRAVPLYIEAVSDIVVDSKHDFTSYSFDRENWLKGKFIKELSAGCRVYFQPSTINVSVEGEYSIGGKLHYDYLYNNTITLSGNLVYANNLIIDFSRYFNDDKVTFFKNKTSLVKAPEVITCYGENYSEARDLSEWFSGCSALKTPPAILIGKAYTNTTTGGSFKIINLYNGCSSIDSEIIIKYEYINPSSNVYAEGWLDGVPVGTLVLTPNIYKKLKDQIPDGWNVKLSDFSSDIKYIEFTIDDNVYHADDNMTWADWIGSEYNTIGLVQKDSQIKDASDRILYLGSDHVYYTHNIKSIIGSQYHLVSES